MIDSELDTRCYIVFVSNVAGGAESLNALASAFDSIQNLRQLNAPLAIRDVVKLNTELDTLGVALAQEDRCLVVLLSRNGRDWE